MRSATLPTIRAPQQRRSRRTLERILSATERLLEKRPFEEISVKEIVQVSRTSIGSFYARFPDKESLLPSLYERYDQSVEKRLAEWRQRANQAATLHEVSLEIVHHFIRFFRERRFLLRALAIYVRTSPHEVAPESRERRVSQHRILLEALLRHRDRIRHPDPERAVELAVYFAVSACRDRILFSESTHAASTRLSDDELTTEVARMILGYLNIDEEPAGPRAGRRSSQ